MAQGGPVVVTGGRTWNGVLEADAMRDDLVRGGVPREAILRERCALTTRGNAQLTAQLLGRLGALRATLVTCDWHMARAALLFRKEGVDVEPLPVLGPVVPSVTRWVRAVHEWGATRLDLAGGTTA